MTTETTEIMLEVEGILEDVLTEIFHKRVCPMLEYYPNRRIRMVVTTQPLRFRGGADGGNNFFSPAEPGHNPEFTWKAGGDFQTIVHQFRFDFLGNLDARALESYVLFGVYKEEARAAEPPAAPEPPSQARPEPSAAPQSQQFSSVAIVPLECMDEVQAPQLQVVTEGCAQRLADLREEEAPETAAELETRPLAEVIDAMVAAPEPEIAAAAEEASQFIEECRQVAGTDTLNDEEDPAPADAWNEEDGALDTPPARTVARFTAEDDDDEDFDEDGGDREDDLLDEESAPAPGPVYFEPLTFVEAPRRPAPAAVPAIIADPAPAPVPAPAAAEEIPAAATRQAAAPAMADEDDEEIDTEFAADEEDDRPAGQRELRRQELRGNVYQEFFAFDTMPFNNTPDTQYYYPTRRHQEALARLIYTISERKGFVLLTGSIGCGKSTLCRELLARLTKQTKTALITHTHLGAAQLLRAIAEDFGLATEGVERFDIQQAINNFLIEQHAQGHTACIIIDEAQNLSTEALEEVRMISNLETEQEKLVQIVLIAQPEMRRKIAAPELEQLRQRIAVHYHLEPLSSMETVLYIRHRLMVACPRLRLDFKHAAMLEVHRFTGGVPRLINTMCDTALLIAYGNDRRRIGEGTIREAARDLRLKPCYSRLKSFFNMM